VPFDQLLVFCTNVAPKTIVDEAFLRRIPYKVRVEDPSTDQFRRVLCSTASSLGLAYDDDVFDYLIQCHYQNLGRSFHLCHSRDLLQQVRHQCEFDRKELRVTREALNEAVSNYFGNLD